jgi:hypothetical protein
VGNLEQPLAIAPLDGELHRNRSTINAHQRKTKRATPGGGMGVFPKEGRARRVGVQGGPGRSLPAPVLDVERGVEQPIEVFGRRLEMLE